MSSIILAPEDQLAPETVRFYRHALEILYRADIPFLVGGAYAFANYTGIIRHTKDFDLFLRPFDARIALKEFAQAGYPTELTFSHWLGKAFHGDDFVDFIFGSGNGACPIDGKWFQHAVEDEVFGVEVRMVPAEEMLWQKAYIMERERFDGGDVLHLLRARGAQLDWDRLLARFGADWRVLLSHLVLFGFVYPEDRESIPSDVLRQLTERLHTEPSRDDQHICRGPLLSRLQYLTDTEKWGYTDARQLPFGRLTRQQIDHWTSAGRAEQQARMS